MIKRFYILVLSALAISVQGQIPVPAPAQQETVLLMNGTAHLGNGEVIENSMIGFENGKLVLVANAKTIRIDMNYYKTKIDCQGKHIYPGFIAPNSTLGLTEIGAVRATHDYKDVGEFKPHVRSVIAYQPESKITSTIRSNGVLMGQTTPRGGLITGTSSIVEFDAWNWEDAVYKKDDAIHLNWPVLFKKTGWWAEPGVTQKNDKSKEAVQKIKTFFEEARAYAQTAEPEEINLRLEAMRGVFDGNKTVFINANSVKQITQAVNFILEFKIQKPVIVGGYDAWMVTDMLRENKIPVVLRRVHSLPIRPEDDLDLPYKLPYLLKKAGILFCLDNSGDMEAMNTRNLAFLAGTAAAYGLTKEEALMSITANTAKILGIHQTVGTLEQGKDATLIVSTGDALDMMTNNIEYAFIRGKKIDLDNHQKQLYEKFKAKYNRGNK